MLIVNQKLVQRGSLSMHPLSWLECRVGSNFQGVQDPLLGVMVTITRLTVCLIKCIIPLYSTYQNYMTFVEDIYHHLEEGIHILHRASFMKKGPLFGIFLSPDS